MIELTVTLVLLDGRTSVHSSKRKGYSFTKYQKCALTVSLMLMLYQQLSLARSFLSWFRVVPKKVPLLLFLWAWSTHLARVLLKLSGPSSGAEVVRDLIDVRV